jgi:hypothetical protein
MFNNISVSVLFTSGNSLVEQNSDTFELLIIHCGFSPGSKCFHKYLISLFIYNYYKLINRNLLKNSFSFKY